MRKKSNWLGIIGKLSTKHHTAQSLLATFLVHMCAGHMSVEAHDFPIRVPQECGELLVRVWSASSETGLQELLPTCMCLKLDSTETRSDEAPALSSSSAPTCGEAGSKCTEIILQALPRGCMCLLPSGTGNSEPITHGSCDFHLSPHSHKVMICWEGTESI
jgi:hypothetical protein